MVDSKVLVYDVIRISYIPEQRYFHNFLLILYRRRLFRLLIFTPLKTSKVRMNCNA